METGESNQPVRGRGKNKRPWTTHEDEKLVECLQEICSNGRWKSESGFRNGYLQQLEKLIEQKLPGCDRKATPHIESRVKWFKTKYNVLREMLQQKSSFSWDNTRKMLTCEKNAYENWVKVHKEAKGLFGVSFPHLDALREVFGRVKPTGLGTETFTEAINNMDLKEATNEAIDDSNDGFLGDDEDQSTTQPSTSTRSAHKKARKSKLSTTNKSAEVDPIFFFLENISRQLASFVDRFIPQLEKMADAMAYEKEVAQKSSKVVDELMKIKCLTANDIIKAADILVSNPSKITVFFSLPDHMKRSYVLNILLHGSGGGASSIH